MADLSSWLPTLLGPDTVRVDGEAIEVRRNKINFVGATQEDDPDNDATDVKIGGHVGTNFTIYPPEYPEVSTDSTAETTLASFTMSDETLCSFDAIVTCARQTAVTKGGRYKRAVTYRRTGGGAPEIVGDIETGTDAETTSGDDVTFDVSGNAVRLRVTAADSDPRNWGAEFRAQEQRG